MIVQKLKSIDTRILDIAERYYDVLLAVNGIRLAQRQLQLLAFAAVKGTISYNNNKEEFCKLYDSSAATINNIVPKLKKLNLMVKKDKKIVVNPAIALDWSKVDGLLLEIRLNLNLEDVQEQKA